MKPVDLKDAVDRTEAVIDVSSGYVEGEFQSILTIEMRDPDLYDGNPVTMWLTVKEAKKLKKAVKAFIQENTPGPAIDTRDMEGYDDTETPTPPPSPFLQLPELQFRDEQDGTLTKVSRYPGEGGWGEWVVFDVYRSPPDFDASIANPWFTKEQSRVLGQYLLDFANS